MNGCCSINRALSARPADPKTRSMGPRLPGLPDGMLAAWLAFSLAGVVVYFALAGASYLAVFVVGRRRFHPSYVADRAQNRRAMRLSVLGLLVSIGLTMPLRALIDGGRGLYWSPTGRGVVWLVASALLYVAFVDTGIYWAHRAMHVGFLYRRVHRYHHAWRVPNSWTSMAFHPVDAFVLALPVHLFPLLVPLNGWLYLAMQGAMSLWSVASHDRVALVRSRWVNFVDHHTLHHFRYRCNFGQFFTFWDRVMGTWRDPAADAARLPAGVLR